MALLSVDGLSVAYGSQPALEQVSFTLAPGEILGVVGGSGSGIQCVTAISDLSPMPTWTDHAARS